MLDSLSGILEKVLLRIYILLFKLTGRVKDERDKRMESRAAFRRLAEVEDAGFCVVIGLVIKKDLSTLDRSFLIW